MKRNASKFSVGMLALCLVTALVLAPPLGLAQLPNGSTTAVLSSPTVRERGPHHRIWEYTEYATAPDGRPIPRVHQYTELASGMHYRDTNGAWADSKAEIEMFRDGAIARHGPHKVIFAANLATEGAIDVETASGVRLRSHVLGLSYFDTASGRSVLIAEVKDCLGEVVPPNVVLYRDAFTDLLVDVRFTYTLSGLEQDVILRERPAAGPENYGLNPQTTKLQVLTEFVSPPTPTKTRRLVEGQADDDLDFGQWHIVPGKAYAEPGADGMSVGGSGFQEGTPVTKQWLKLDGRDFLVEEVPLQKVAPELDRLPRTHASISPSPNAIRHLASTRRLLPAVPGLAKVDQPKPRMKLAAAQPAGLGFVMDYISLGSSVTDYTFQGDRTYYVSGPVSLYGTTQLEGGAVLKFTNLVHNGQIYLSQPYLYFYGPLRCDTAPYRPAVFTAKDDNTVGETINGSTGTPLGLYAYMGLSFYQPPALDLHDLRISHAAYGVLIQHGWAATHVVRDSQFCRNSTAVYSDYGNATLRNLLLYQSSLRAVYGYSSTIQGEHLTIHQANRPFDGGNISLTNSLLVLITNWPTGFTSDNNATSSSPSAVFETVGGGAHYLAPNSTNRNAGTTNISASLLAELRTKTTYPPIAYSNTTFTAPLTFNPQAQRDTDFPDLGYHYDPLDYTFGGCATSSNLTFTAGTAVGWFRTTSGWYHAGQGLRMQDNITVSFEGSATEPTYFVRLNTVQEADRTAGYGHAGIDNWEGPAIPTVRGGFLSCMAMAGEVLDSFFGDDFGGIRAEMTHSEFWGGSLRTYGNLMSYTNCLMWRSVGVGVLTGGSGSSFSLRNCTLLGGQLCIQRASDYGPTTVVVRDCSFDGTAFTLADAYSSNPTYTDYDYNAYTNLANPFPLGGSNDVMVANSFAWQSSWLGNFYLPTNSPLINAGSVTNAGLAGLYHHTTTTNQMKEASSVLDIGFHYVAVSGGSPSDTDGDGIPDYLEDVSGNGSADSGETNWQVSENGTTGSPGLLVFTQLR